MTLFLSIVAGLLAGIIVWAVSWVVAVSNPDGGTMLYGIILAPAGAVAVGWLVHSVLT